ncbi:MAG: hypothetical protein IKT56_06920 [Clostridia bacterium]|nr:hypothetical protein [Clostridia bacterium]
MTEEYRSELVSRILRLNNTNRLYIKRILFLILFGGVSLICGYFVSIFLPITDSNISVISASHFCGFFDGLGILDKIRALISFMSPDFWAVFLIMSMGYTMLASGLSKILFFGYTVRLGFCISYLYRFLIVSPNITDGTNAFVLFTVCKLIILIALVFSVIKSEDFSYQYADQFQKSSRPFFGQISMWHIKTTVSTCGFTALINIIYLIFQSLLGCSLL